MKTAYLFLDRAYFTFRNVEGGFLTQCKTKKESESAEALLGDFANELLNTVLREKLSSDNRAIREKIYSSALAHCFREPEELSCKPNPVPTMEKDLDLILQEIEEELGIGTESEQKNN